MTQNITGIPRKPKIETEHLPIEWLYDLALREGNSKKPIYRIHKWWARRLGSIFRALLLLATTPSSRRRNQIAEDFYSRHDLAGLVVLDPFMGGGTSIVEASKCNARTIGIDIDPVAWFVTKKEIEPWPQDEIRATLEQLEKTIGGRIQSYYQTYTPEGRAASVIYFFWVDIVVCPQCRFEFEAHPHYQLSRDRKNARQIVFCSKCHATANLPLSRASFTCSECGNLNKINQGPVQHGKFVCPKCSYSDLIVSTIQAGRPLDKRLFAVEYETEIDGKITRNYKAADSRDVQSFQRTERLFKRLRHKLSFPPTKIPIEGRSDLRPVSHGYAHYYQLFNPRQLLCLSLLWHEIAKITDGQVREYFMIAFSDSLASNNLLCSYAFDYQKLTPLFGLHAFNVVNRPVENNVWGTHYGRGSFLKCIGKMQQGKEYAEHPYEIKYRKGEPTHIVTGETITSEVTTSVEEWQRGNAQSLLMNCSSTDLAHLANNSVDLVLTDPPYYNNLSYSELSDFFYVWLRKFLPANDHRWKNPTTPYRQALFVAKNDNGSSDRFVESLTKILRHCKRVLKPNGLMVFTFHHRNFNAWKSLAQALWGAGFGITNVFPVRSEGKSGFHSSSGSIKWDAVIVCRPKKKGKLIHRGSRGFLKSVLATQRKWEQKLRQSNHEFQWVDSLSLGYSIAVRYAVALAASQDELLELLDKANTSLLKRLSDSQRELLA